MANDGKRPSDWFTEQLSDLKQDLGRLEAQSRQTDSRNERPDSRGSERISQPPKIAPPPSIAPTPTIAPPRSDGCVLHVDAENYLDTLVGINNAGVRGDPRAQTLQRMDYEKFTQVMAVNVYGALAVSRAFVDQVAASRQKKIVSISSVMGSIASTRPPRETGVPASPRLSRSMRAFTPVA